MPIFLWVLPLIGAILLPGLWWTAADSPFAFRLDLIAMMTLFVALVAVAALAALSRGFRHRIRWSLGVATAVVVTAFQWRTFTLAGEGMAETTGMALAADVIPIVLAGGVLWLATRLAQDWQYVLITGIAMAMAIGVLGLTGLGLVAPAPSVQAIEPARPNSPDVLLLVLDGYGRADWLESEYNFDNSAFLEELELRGFAVASAATPNYGYTYASVSTMLNLDYVFAPGEILDDELERMRAALTGAAGLIPAFQGAGYEIAYLENGWGGSQCGSAIDWCIRDGLTERSLWTLGQMTILAPVFRLMRPKAFHTVTVDHLDSLGDYVSTPHANGNPRFTYAHLLLPHAPLLLDAECNGHSQDDLRRWGSAEGEILTARRFNYAEQTRCVNSKVLNALDALISMNPSAIVMITGDHGPGSLLDATLPLEELSEATIQDRMKILSAYRLPGCESSFRVDLTPVNGTRIITNCALGSELPRLQDQNHWVNWDGEGPVTDITSRLDN